MIEKNEFRLRLKQIRNDMDKKRVQTFSDIIASRLKDSLDWTKVKKLHCYVAKDELNEVNTNDIIDFAKKNNLIIVHPNLKEIPKDQTYDLVIIPLLGFDKNGNRLGFGGGYYDKFLAQNKSGLKVGLAYSIQEQESIPTEPHDVKLDMVVTEKQIFDFRK